jgi:hypothetical protein
VKASTSDFSSAVSRSPRPPCLRQSFLIVHELGEGVRRPSHILSRIFPAVAVFSPIIVYRFGQLIGEGEGVGKSPHIAASLIEPPLASLAGPAA